MGHVPSVARIVASACLFVIDGRGLVRWLDGTASTSEVLGIHVLAVLVLGAAYHAIARRRSRGAIDWIALALLFGPFGGFVLCLFHLGDMLSRPDAADVSETPDTMPASTSRMLADRIRDNRRNALGPNAPLPFADVFSSGDLGTQQRAIASISRSYRPEMRDGLRIALASDVPAIRVQAAAVHAKLRGAFDARATALLALPRPLEARECREALDVARSGFAAPETAAALVERAGAGPRTAPSGAPLNDRRDCPSPASAQSGAVPA